MKTKNKWRNKKQQNKFYKILFFNFIRIEVDDLNWKSVNALGSSIGTRFLFVCNSSSQRCLPRSGNRACIGKRQIPAVQTA